MRLLFGGLCLLIVVCTFCVINLLYIESSLENMISGLEELELQLTVFEWDRAQDLSQKLLKQWKSKSEYYKAVLWHQHVDDITVTLHIIENSLTLQDLETVTESIVEAKTVIRDMIEMESLSLGNIF